MNLGNRYVAMWMTNEVAELKDLGLDWFNQGYDRAAQLVYGVAHDLEGQLRLLRTLEDM